MHGTPHPFCKPFEVGEPVKLRGPSSQIMLVDSMYFDRVTCTWTDADGKLQQMLFTTQMLEKVTV